MPTKKLSSPRTQKKSTTLRKGVTVAKAVKSKTSVTMIKPIQSQIKNKPLVTKPPRNLHLGMHFIIAGSAICVMLLLGVIERNTFATNLSSAEDNVPSTIGLEHDAPLSLSVLFAKKENAGYVSINNQSNETIHISLPSGWTRTEVTGATLKEVAQDIPVFGFTRWTLPGNAGMKLLMTSAPTTVFFDSTSNSTAAIDLKTIDLTTLDATNKVILVQKQSLVTLWGSNE